MWNRILIARPGEVAARVARTCKRLGITAVAAVGESRSEGVHTDACDEIRKIGERADGTVDPAEVVRVFHEIGADAIYSGYGVDAWDRELARALEAADVPFVGPDPDAIDLAWDRLALRKAAERAFVRMVPGGASPIASLADAFAAADEVGYPIVLRPIGVDADLELARFEDEEALERGFDEYAAKAAGLPLCLEHEIERARVLDVLVAADMHGEVLGLSETETTLSAAGKPRIDESPSPELLMRGDGESIRLGMFDAAIRLAAELRTPGLVTVRFLLDPSSRLFVADVALGLPLQHAICEMVTGLDLVGVQLAIAAGEPLPDDVHTVQPSGHAFGAVVGLLPNGGEPKPVREIRFPPAPQRQVRVEPMVIEGQVPSGELLDALCRITTYAPIRHQALLTLDRMLAELDLSPLETTSPRLRAILAEESYRAGQYDTEFLDARARAGRGHA
jgi:acetyl/propionyl-CoA carboxylase alpha subunit